MVLHSNAVSHWLGAYTQWTLIHWSTIRKRHLQMRFLSLSWEKKTISWIGTWLMFFPEVDISQKPAVLQVMALCQTSDKALSESMMIDFHYDSSTRNILRVTGPLWGKSTGDSPHKGQWRGALVFSLIYTWANGWVNNRDVGDLRRHRTHYDVPVIMT